jgi:hypothetical protein
MPNKAKNMAQFIHLFDEKQEKSIRKNGIKLFHSKWRKLNGVFAFPQTENFVVNHQWSRELRRRNGQVILAARFRLPDDETVFIGKYNEEHIEVTASKAIGIARSHVDPLGLEVIISRPIAAKEIIAVYKPLKVVGWRYSPNAKGRAPCGCSYCQRGEPYSQRIQRAFDG